MRRNHNALRINSEHRAYWSSEQNTALPDSLHELKFFFRRYAGKCFRTFPWRRARTKPFHLLVAELLLVQTKAEDVARLWPLLTRRYCDPLSLAHARESTLISFLQPLGLQRQRACALKAASRALVDLYGGEVPKTVEELLAIPHVGLYVATAVACFAFGDRVPIVDANVIRVFDRITGRQGVRELRRRFDVWQLAWAALPRTHAIAHNYGLLDFAAQTCTSRAPRCARCGLVSICTFGQKILHVERRRGTE